MGILDTVCEKHNSQNVVYLLDMVHRLRSRFWFSSVESLPMTWRHAVCLHLTYLSYRCPVVWSGLWLCVMLAVTLWVLFHMYHCMQHALRNVVLSLLATVHPFQLVTAVHKTDT